MKVYFLKRKGRNWRGNFPFCLTVNVGGNNKWFYADYMFYRRKDAAEYNKKYDGKYGSPYVVWSAEMKEDLRDNRCTRKGE